MNHVEVIQIEKKQDDLQNKLLNKNKRKISYKDYVIKWSKPLLNGITPSPRGGHSCILAGNQLILFGGHYFSGKGCFTYLNETWTLDLETSTWYDVQCNGNIFPLPRYDHKATLLGHQMYIFGGKGQDNKIFKDMYILDLQTWSWSNVKWTSDSPSPRFGHSQLAIGNNIVVFGGWDGKQTFGDLWVFSTETYNWLKPKTLNNPPPPSHGHSMDIINDTKIMIWGGYTTSIDTNKKGIVRKNQYFSTLYYLDTETMTWSRPRVIGNYPLPRFSHSTCVDNDLKIVYLIGGWPGTTKYHICHGEKMIKQEKQEKIREKTITNRTTKYEQPDNNTESLEITTKKQSSFLHILNTENMIWERPESRGIEISNRYGHTCTLVGPYIFMFGGWDGNRALNELIVGELPEKIPENE